MGVVCVLPARLSSTRIPRKPLQPLADRPLIEWSWRAAVDVDVFDRIVVATDAPEIADCAEAFGAEVVRTRKDHASGTDRVEEATRSLGLAEGDLVVNLQADEPFVDAATLGRLVGFMVEAKEGRGGADVGTLAAPIRSREEWESAGVVKVVRASDGRALYFSRSPVPCRRDPEPGSETGESGEGRPEAGDRAGPAPRLRHIGVYVLDRAALRRWSGLPESPLERSEKLEQLRALEAGMRFHVEVGPWTEPGIDLPADLARAERVLSERTQHEGGMPGR